MARLIRIIEVVIEVGIGLNKMGILIIITVRIRHYELNVVVFIVPTAMAIENTSFNTLTSFSRRR